MLTSGHLFAGGGGDTEGAIAAGYKPIWAVEYDKYAAAVYRKRFPIIPNEITDILEGLEPLLEEGLRWK